ncbi:thioredoxin-like [Pseudophryne corroboree]|uniref:thioredoxin-like n=1 Tax=Pseudophryne corroboree TaxID=495146 RepID=UPI0030819618
MVKYIESLSEFTVLVETAGDKLLVIDYTAKWCGPCQKIAPVFEALADKYPCVLLYKVDVDEAEDIAGANGIKAMPTFHFYKNGAKIEELRGADPAKLEALVAKHM